MDNFIATGLPQPVFLLAVVDEGAVPAVGAADGGNDLLVFGGDEAQALSYLEVLGTAEVPDEFLTDGMLNAGRHVVVEARHAFLLHDTNVLAELRAVFPSDLWVAGIHGGLYERYRVGILAHEPVQALLFERTTLDETQCVVVNLPLEGFFLRRCRLLLFFLLFHSAKVRISEDNTKQNKELFVFIVERKYLRQSQRYE